MKTFIKNVFALGVIFLASEAVSGQPLISDIFMNQAEVYEDRGVPIATDNFHDISNYELNSTQGFPNKEFKIRFNGLYKYFLHKELTQESIVQIKIHWGDGKSNEYTPNTYPFEASHRFGVDWVYDVVLGAGTWRINVNDETTYNIAISMTTYSGTVFTSNVSYTIHMNESGFGSPARTSNSVKDYWRNDDCIMINNVCYLEEIITHKLAKKDIIVPVTMPDTWSKGRYSSYEGISSIEKHNLCVAPFEIVGGRCRKSIMTPGSAITVDTIQLKTPLYPEPSPWIQLVWMPAPLIHNIIRTKVQWADRKRKFVIYGAPQTEACTNNLKSAPIPSYNSDQNRYMFWASCVIYAQFEGCSDISQTPTLFEGKYYCDIESTPATVTYEYDNEWEVCHNKPAISHNKDSNGFIKVDGKFDCYSSIVVKKTCELPYLPINGQCQWDELIHTPRYDETSSDIPKDTYGR